MIIGFRNWGLSKKRVRMLATFFSVTALTAVFPACEARNPSVQFCDLVTVISTNVEKRNYLKRWIGSHLNSARFRESVRDRRVFPGDDDRMQEFGDLDWSYLGIAEGTGSLEFHGAMESSGKLDTSRINAVEFWLGRSSIFVRLNAELYPRQSWKPERLTVMKAAGSDVFYYCDSGT